MPHEPDSSLKQNRFYVQDDLVLGEAVREHVASLGYGVDLMRRLDDGRLALQTVHYELILLDLNLPDGRGLDLLRDLRRQGSAVPVIILTAQDQIAARIDGLNSGADDYLVKPFDLSELSARVAAVARRYGGNPNPLLHIGNLDIDVARRFISVSGKPVELTSREWAVFERLVRHPNLMVSKADIEDSLYEFGAEIDSNAVEVYFVSMARNSPSITLRLIFSLTFCTLVLWSAAASYSIFVSYRELNEAFDGVLVEAGHRLLPLAADDVLGHEQDDGRAIHHFIEGRREYLSYQLRDSSGHIVLRTHDAPSEPYHKEAKPGLSSAGHYRLYTETDETTGLTITVAETNDGRWEALAGSISAMLWPLAGLIPLNMLIVWLVVRRAMKPVSRLSDDIFKRSGQNLSPLDSSGQPAELQPISDAVARLLERLRLALDAERSFAANSAHELRTPIAGALAQTQRLIAELHAPEDRRRARNLEATLKRLAGLAEKLMQISRVDAGFGQSEAAIDLVPVLDLVVGDCARRLDASDLISYQKSEGTTLVARMDMDAFAIAIRNLIDNAISHGAPAAKIDIKLEPNSVIRVINKGEIVPQQILERLKHRFTRGDSRSSGSGLGLSIVENIMQQTGGTLELLSPASGQADGFEARLTIATV
eukprot:gene15523-15670_t